MATWRASDICNRAWSPEGGSQAVQQIAAASTQIYKSWENPSVIAALREEIGSPWGKIVGKPIRNVTFGSWHGLVKGRLNGDLVSGLEASTWIWSIKIWLY